MKLRSGSGAPRLLTLSSPITDRLAAAVLGHHSKGLMSGLGGRTTAWTPCRSEGEMDGWEATRRIKAEPETAGIPIIAVTAHASSADRVTSIEAGCADFDTKPIDFNRLLAKIGRVL